MKNSKFIILVLLLFESIFLFGQCEYTLQNFSHNDCFGDNNGSIEITIFEITSSVDWTGPDGFSSSSTTLNNLYAGTYYLTITNNIEFCTFVDSIDIEQSIQISADFNLTGRCQDQDSVDVSTVLWGGTPPYYTVWSNGDTSRNIMNLPSTSVSPHILTITDFNSCIDTVHLWVPQVHEMNPFMSSVGTICKDDNSGEARVFIQEGTPPFQFNWISEGTVLYPQNDVLIIDSFSSISNLLPGIYSVEIVDDMGCVIKDSIEVKSNPGICLTYSHAFSPNGDGINEFWEIKNIHLYPEAIVSVYNSQGVEIFRRRNYLNADDYAFNGKNKDGNDLPSAAYYYIIDLVNGDEVFKGVIAILR